MNIAKKIEKAKNNGLAEGEQVLNAILLNDPGAVAGAVVQGGLGGLVGIFFGNKMKKKAETKQTEGTTPSDMSKKIPTGMSVLGVTGSRIVSYDFNQMSGKAKDLKAEFKVGDIKVESYEKGTMAHKLVLSFSDGGKRAFDLPRGNDIESFKEVL